MRKILPTLLSTVIFCFVSQPHVHAEPDVADDTPSPQILKEKAGILHAATNKLARDFRAASAGKNWGLSPGHKALYQSIFNYRDELETVTEMCKAGESPDRLLTVALDCKLKGQAMTELAVFVILPKELSEQISKLSERSSELLAPIQQYEQRYFTWRKVDLERKHANDLARLQRELAALKSNQDQIVQRTNEISSQQDCPPQQVIVVEPSHSRHPAPPRSHPSRNRPAIPAGTTTWPDPQSPQSPPVSPPVVRPPHNQPARPSQRPTR
ncbi:hypothetical protein [Oceaniferula spumae]